MNIKKALAIIAGATLAVGVLAGCSSSPAPVPTPTYLHPHPTSTPIAKNAPVSDVNFVLDAPDKKVTFTANRNDFNNNTYTGKLTVYFLVNNQPIGNAQSIYSKLAGTVLNVSFFLPAAPKPTDQYSVKIVADPQAGFDTSAPIYFYDK